MVGRGGAAQGRATASPQLLSQAAGNAVPAFGLWRCWLHSRGQVVLAGYGRGYVGRRRGRIVLCNGRRRRQIEGWSALVLAPTAEETGSSTEDAAARCRRGFHGSFLGCGVRGWLSQIRGDARVLAAHGQSIDDKKMLYRSLSMPRGTHCNAQRGGREQRHAASAAIRLAASQWLRATQELLHQWSPYSDTQEPAPTSDGDGVRAGETAQPVKCARDRSTPAWTLRCWLVTSTCTVPRFLEASA